MKVEGQTKKKADPLTAEEEEELLWESGALGCNNSESLNHSLWYTLSQHFGTRGVQEHLQMNFKDFKFVRKPGTIDVEYVEWTEGLTKPQPALWYSKQSVGKGKVKEFMKTIAKMAGMTTVAKDSQTTTYKRHWCINCKRRRVK